MVTSDSPKIIVLGIDGLEYNLVEEWRLKNIMQKAHCKLNLSDYKVVVTPPIWGSMLTGKIDDEIMEIWIKHAEIMGDGVHVKRKWWTNLGKILPTKVNFWFYNHLFEKSIGGDPFSRTANYVLEKNEPNVFQFFEKSWTNGIPGYGRNVSTHVEKKLTEQAISGKSTPFRKHILNFYKKDKIQLFSALDKNEFDFIFWYTTFLDHIGHIDMGKRVTLMMKHYLEINELVGAVAERYPDSLLYIISDHGMEQMGPKSRWGLHSNHAFFSSNTGETIEKPFQLYNLISKHKSG